ncbi:MAG: hypothetical protein KBA72_10070 [Thermoanaerobaculia bacterium]|nr:hypothetical protein [Thermoanaerobaculia bacterium]
MPGGHSARSWLAAALPAALPAAMLLAASLGLTVGGGRVAAAETLFLSFWAAAVFTPLAFLPTARGATHAALAVATTALIAALPRSGGLRPVAVAAVLALSVAVLAALALTPRPAPGLRTAGALALATAFVLHGHRLFLDGLSTATLVLLALLPGVAAAIATRLAAVGRPGAGLAAALLLLAAPQLAAEPWWTLLAFATAASVASLASGTTACLARRALFLFGAATMLAGSFPWLRTAPVATLAGALAALDRPVVETPLSERAVVLTPEAPVFEAKLNGARVRSLVIDSYLTHGDDLACDRPFATVVFEELPENNAAPASPGARWSSQLVAGRDSAEWAAGRPDVAARLACPAPAAWISWIPGGGRFLGQTTRARIALPGPRAGHRLRIERSAELPGATTLAIFLVATER